MSDTALGAGDVFRIVVFGEKDLTGRYRVSAAGTIDYPLIGTLQVGGLTPPEIAALVRQKLAAGFLKDPHVSVFVKAYDSKKISVFGQVQKPGTFGYVNNMSIVEAITLAGGFTPIASKNAITVTRVEGGKSRRFTVRVEEIGEGSASNYLLRPGDIVFVPERLF
jgi:polysaccharide export outer membrane protein